MTTLQETVVAPIDVRLRLALSQLNEHELSMLGALRMDVQHAKSKLNKKAVLSTLRKRKHHFYVLPANADVDRALKQSPCCWSSNLVLESGVITLELMNKLLGILRLEGHLQDFRVSDAEHQPAQASCDIPCEFYRYRVEFD